MQRIVLVGIGGHDVSRLRVLQPHPLERAGLEHRGRRIGVVLEQLRGTVAVVGEIEAAIEARVATLPACRDEVPEPLGDTQHAQHALVGDRAPDKLAAHTVKLGRRRLDVALDLFERKGVISALVPVALARNGVEAEAGRLGLLFPVRSFVAGDSLHAAEFSRPRTRDTSRFPRSSRSRRAWCCRCPPTWTSRSCPRRPPSVCANAAHTSSLL